MKLSTAASKCSVVWVKDFGIGSFQTKSANRWRGQNSDSVHFGGSHFGGSPFKLRNRQCCERRNFRKIAFFNHKFNNEKIA
jgi:hypothetical protein